MELDMALVMEVAGSTGAVWFPSNWEQEIELGIGKQTWVCLTPINRLWKQGMEIKKTFPLRPHCSLVLPVPGPIKANARKRGHKMPGKSSQLKWSGLHPNRNRDSDMTGSCQKFNPLTACNKLTKCPEQQLPSHSRTYVAWVLLSFYWFRFQIKLLIHLDQIIAVWWSHPDLIKCIFM